MCAAKTEMCTETLSEVLSLDFNERYMHTVLGNDRLGDSRTPVSVQHPNANLPEEKQCQ